MILDHTGRPLAATIDEPATDPRNPATITRKPNAEAAALAKRLTESRTQLDSIRMGVYLRHPSGDRKRYQIAPGFIQDFAGMIRRQRLKYIRCFVEIRDRVGTVYGQWRREADLSNFAHEDFKRILPSENREETT